MFSVDVDEHILQKERESFDSKQLLLGIKVKIIGN